MNKNQKRTLATLAALAITLAVVNASVFAYYPISVAVRGTVPDVKLAQGSNAGQADLGGHTITVTLTGNTKADITIHPTNEKTYYKDVLKIQNYKTGNYYGWVKVNTPFTATGITSAKLYIYEGTTLEAEIDLMTDEVQPASAFAIPASPDGTTPGELRVDIEIQISSTATASEITDTASIELVYSPQSSETPP